MKMLNTACILLVLCGVGVSFVHARINLKLLEKLEHLNSKTSPDDQAFAVEMLLQRVIPDHFEKFVISVNRSYFNLKHNLDAFELDSSGARGILIRGTTGVAAAAGFYHYLKYWCGCHVSWSGDQLNIPNVLPVVKEKVRIYFQERLRYYQNVCTVSYSMAFWNWSRWEKEIDWMAMHGINFPLAFTAQEAIWQMVYTKLGLTQEELDFHFSGPAFLAWQRMGNVDKWGGPLPASWYQQQLNLQHNILGRMRSLGMIPVLPGFAGHIPKALVTRLYRNATYYDLSSWNSFTEEYSTALLDSQDPLFKKVGGMFLEAQDEVYNGTDHVYNADVYNEMHPAKLTPDFMRLSSLSIYESLKAYDPNAVWVMQAWLFLASYWTDELMKAWITAVPSGRLILLDLASELEPIFSRTSGFYGQPFIWNMIENFGGNTRLFGQLGIVATGIQKARAGPYGSNMIGIGATPEGIDQNEVNFELLYEMGWRNESFNLTEWGVNYASRRFASLNTMVKTGWKTVIHDIYDCQQAIHNGGSAAGRPVLFRPYITKTINPVMWYHPKNIRDAWRSILNGRLTMQDTVTFRHDLVKIGTQVLEDISIVLYQRMMDAYFSKSLVNFMVYGSHFLDLVKDMDSLLSAEPYSLLGVWIESARQFGQSDTDKKLLEYNARNQITLWGPNGNILDYANKNWGGLLSSYYFDRWSAFVNITSECLKEGKSFNQSSFNQLVFQLGDKWTKDSTSFPAVPVGDVYEISDALLKKYGDLTNYYGIYSDRLWNDALVRMHFNSNEIKNQFLRKRFIA